jgi:hypothetical protein
MFCLYQECYFVFQEWSIDELIHDLIVIVQRLQVGALKINLHLWKEGPPIFVGR